MENIKEATNSFLAHCQFEKNLDPKTLKAYSIDLKQVYKFLVIKQYPAFVTSIDKIVLREYLQTISNLKPKTVKRKVATIKALFNYLEFEDRIPVNPFRKMKIQIREPKNLPTVMNLFEVERIIQSAYKTSKEITAIKGHTDERAIRNIAVIELLFASGARVSELSRLKTECVDLIEGQIKVRGKGNKERIIQICHKEALKSLNNYYALFRDRIDNGTGYFFINRFNTRLSEQSIRFLVKKQAKSASLDRKITPHVFRHSFATLLLEENVDIKYIQQLLGHSSILTTQIYTHVTSIKQKQILQNHPRRSFHAE